MLEQDIFVSSFWEAASGKFKCSWGGGGRYEGESGCCTWDECRGDARDSSIDLDGRTVEFNRSTVDLNIRAVDPDGSAIDINTNVDRRPISANRGVIDPDKRVVQRDSCSIVPSRNVTPASSTNSDPLPKKWSTQLTFCVEITVK